MSDYNYKMLEITHNRLTHEYDIYMSRNTIMLALNSAILTVVLAVEIEIKYLMVFLGSGITIMWIVINYISIQWIKYWGCKVSDYEKKVTSKTILNNDKDPINVDHTVRKKPPKWIIEYILFGISIAFIGIWLILLIGI